MHLKTLSLQNFRNIGNINLDLNPEFNFIFGRNAQGKTNLIEAIYYLSALKSFRTTSRSELIQDGSAFARIEGDFVKDDLTWKIEMILTSRDRQVLLNQKKPESRSRYYDLIPLILFEPRHIYLFRDSPSQRREYLSRAVFLNDASFLSVSRDYEKVVSQKNKLLKEGRDLGLLDVWNEQIVDLGATIMEKRLSWFRNVQGQLIQEYQSLTNLSQVLDLIYVPSQNLLCEDEIFSASLCRQDFMTLLSDKLKEKRHEEMARAESLVGPHRDDFYASLNGRHLGHFGSQGENRSAMIALKLTQLKIYAQRHHKTPLFLLDDVASELDEFRCQYLFSYLKNENAQVFLTTTENRIQGKGFAGHASSFLVENGGVSLLPF